MALPHHFPLFLFLFLFSSPTTFATRPQLINSDVWLSETRIIATDYEVLTGNLEFDQPLYLSESVLCPRAEESCEPVDCTLCDWSGQNPDGCNNVNCCGPAEYPDYIDSRNDWCSSNPPHNYTTVQLGVPSPTFTIKTGEIAYFRFFLNEDTLCYPVAVKTRMEYGTTNLMLSRVNPFPTSEEDAQFTRNAEDFGMGQTDWILCPNLMEDFQPGTWSVAVQAIRDSSFRLDIYLGPDQHPIPSSPDAIPCSEVPDSAKLYSEGNVSLCLEEGQTTPVEFDIDFESFYAQLLLPIPQGCHTINLAVIAPRPSGSKESDQADPDLFCFHTGPETPPTYENAILASWKTNGDRLVFTGCFEEEVTYVQCSSQFWVVGKAELIFSIMALPNRFPILDTLPGALTMDQGMQAVSVFIENIAHFPCADYYSACFEWATYPSTDPLAFWPQHYAVETINTVFDPVPPTEYFNKGLSKPLENTISFTVGLRLGKDRIYTLEDVLESGIIILSFVTNEAGEPVELPGRGLTTDFGRYMPNTAFSELNVRTDVSSQCSYESYSELSNLINSRVDQILEVRSLADMTALQFSMDVFNSGLVRLSCLQAGERILEQESQLITKARQTTCEHAFGTPSWQEDPCCNNNLEVITCCLPYDIEVEEDIFISANPDLTQTCGSPECAETFFDDLGSSLNTINDPILGCNSGIKDLQVDLDYEVEIEFNSVLRYCRNEVGLGEGFVGIACQSDDECTDWVGTCGSGGFCDLPPLSIIEDQYLNCYINQMSSVIEDYLRREVLGGEVDGVPKTSPVFFDALRLAASEGACVSPSSPLDLSKRTRREWFSEGGLSCKGQELGYSSPNYDDKILRECPTLKCLGSDSCWGNSADPCYSNCLTEWVDFESEIEEDCGSDVCNVDLSPCEGDDVCVYCAPDGSHPCKVVEGITSQEDCEELVACQLFNGEMILGITEEECDAQQGVCTIDCPGESCQSLRPTNGGCFVSSIADSTSCDAYSATNGVAASWVITDVDSICALDIFDETDCSMYPSTSWSMCSELATDECDGTTATQVHLQCYHSLWQPCTNQEDCENAGACSDRNVITSVLSENPVQVSFGSCFGSGINLFSLSFDLPFFCHTRMEEPIIGCKEIEFPEQDQCKEFEVINGEWYWRTWLTPAMSEGECVNKELGRYGCLFPGDFQHLSWHNDTYCRCMGGFPTYAWEWETGRWIGGQSRPLSWVSISSSSQYEYQSNALSFMMLENWLTAAIEDYFLYDLKSQILCENNVITVPLQAVVCDCLAEDSPKDSSCYSRSSGQRATPVGLSAACSGEASVVKGPSASADFYATSVNERCTQIDLLKIEQTWFSEPPSSSQVSFQFEKNEPRKGFVKNENGVTVGQLVGDGSQLEFSDHERVDEFGLCLLITEGEDDQYPIRDFGWSDSSLSVITPLSVSSDITERRATDSSVFWCANLTLKKVPTEERGTYRLYPIITLEDYEDHDEDYVDKTTKVLCYVLASFYVVDFFLLTLFFFILVRDIMRSTRKTMPTVAWLGVIFMIVCIFRIVYLFAYPNGTFEDEELADFVVFEIPTFLLFTAVILCIFIWRNLAQKKNFFGFAKGSLANRVLIGSSLFAVWMLFLVVVVIYSEVILEKGEEESDCPGRVASTNSLEDDSRTLSIVYQSIIITVTFLLAVVFFHSSYVLFKQSSKGVSEAKQFIFRLGAIIVVAFLLRCVFFIILLAAEFTSSIYMFIVLMITEVFMIFLIHLQFNLRYYRSFFSGTSHLLPTGMRGTSGTVQSRRSSVHASINGTEMDD